MKCEEARELLEALHDDELVPQTRAAVTEHLRSCPDCARALTGLEALRSALSRVERFVAPPELRTRILSALANNKSAAAAWRWPGLGALAASYAAAILLAGSITYLATSAQRQQEFAVEEAVAAHVRSLLDDRSIAVASSDQHTVKPWFAGKLDFSPAVVNLEAQGFPLLGGRLDYVADRYVAALVYGRRNHKITVFVAPSEGSAAANATSRNGYNVQGWVSGDLSYRAVSDLNSQELAQFAGLLQQKAEK